MSHVPFRSRRLKAAAAAASAAIVLGLATGPGPISNAATRPAPRAVAPAATPLAPFTVRTTAGSTPVRDAAGAVWGPRSVGWGSDRTSALSGRVDVARTRDDAVYRTNAWDMRWYWVDVPVKGTYTVRLRMAESFFRGPGQRVFDVRAEGRRSLVGVDAVRAAGYATAYDVTLRVPVTDGRLDLDFVPRVDRPAVSAIEVVGPRVRTSAAPAPVPAVKLSPKAFYRQDISKAPLAANSAAAVKLLSRDVAQNWGGVAAFNAYDFNTSFTRVPAGTPKVRVGFDDCQKKRYTPAGLYSGPKHFVDVPVPRTVVPARGTDGEVTIYDPAADKIWEFWKMSRTRSGGWQACWGARLDAVSTSTQVAFPSPFGASASGLVMAPGMLTMDEIRKGRIDHAMYLTVLRPRAYPHISWPATRTDGGNPDPNSLMEGQRLRLDPRVDVTSLGLTPVGTMIARAAQKYGFVVADGAGAVSVVTESGAAVKAATGSDPWDRLLGGPSYRVMSNFPWNRLQALPKDYGRP